ncbi:hypothetical protein OBBRIDRAFT_797643 [Obba rivulosa]|uniref:Uncharacterized protein n=1 Tax=Obba rivulosa TaxID=1052685 RepID=A0A8E2DFG4_9APHY|nr:hypothetical protein OBBRIDRAFT_797643 [Obba rivulosa]
MPNSSCGSLSSRIQPSSDLSSVVSSQVSPSLLQAALNMCCMALAAGRFRAPSLAEMESPIYTSVIAESNYIVLTLNPAARRHATVRISPYDLIDLNLNKPMCIGEGGGCYVARLGQFE